MKRTNSISILYIVPNQRESSAQKTCLSLFHSMAHAGFTTLLISRHENDKAPCNTLYSFVKLVFAIRAIKRSYRKLIIHTHSSGTAAFERWAAFCAGATVRIHTIHGLAFHKHQPPIVWWPLYLAEFVTNFVTTYFICTSLPDVKTGARLLPNFCNKHTLIRSAVDWPTFSRVTTKRKPFFDKEKKYIFGTIARFQQQKNLIDLFKAFFIVHLQNSAARLEVIGDGPLRESLVSWIGNHKMEHAITLLGWQDAVVQQMKTWHVFVLCSLWEGLPHAIVQARLLKMPVISYDVGGVSDIILHQENGLLYPPGDWQGIASGMLKLSRDPTLYTKLQTHREMLDEFNDQEMIRHHGALYKKIYSKIGDF